MRYKLMIFDFDGTLADSFHLFVDVANRASDKYKFKRIEGDVRERLRDYSARDIFKYLKVPLWKIPLIVNFMRSQMNEYADQIVLFEGVSDLFHGLRKKGVTIAIASSNSQETIRQVLGPANIAMVTYLECDGSVFGKAKSLKKIVRKSGVKKNEAIYLGDEVRDIEAAHAIHIASGAVTWGYNKAECLRKHEPEEFFESFDEILTNVA